MKKLILFLALNLFSGASLFSQENDITREYFMRPLIEEIKAELF